MFPVLLPKTNIISLLIRLFDAKLVYKNIILFRHRPFIQLLSFMNTTVYRTQRKVFQISFAVHSYAILFIGDQRRIYFGIFSPLLIVP